MRRSLVVATVIAIVVGLIATGDPGALAAGRSPSPRRANSAARHRTLLSAPAKSASVSGKCPPISPIAAVTVGLM